jgi:hypothetical protein
LSVALLYLAGAYKIGGGEATLKVAMSLLLPLACIWFSKPLDQYGGTIRGQVMTSPTPAFLVCAGGWLVLVGVPLIAYALRATI